MSLVAAQLVARVTSDTKEGEQGLERVGQKAEEAGQHLDHAGEHSDHFVKHLLEITGALAVLDIAKEGVHLLVDNLGEMVKAGEQANRTEAQTNAVLTSTHGVSGQTAEGVSALATQMMNLTGVQKDAVAGAENMLLTFTNIHGSTFPQATKAALDMATAMNGGATPSAEQLRLTSIQLGKALNDPAHGMTALQRVGVTFSAEQKQQIKQFEAAGNAAGAQAVILAELSKEFGGSARAAGLANGGMAILSAQWESMKETVGQALIPVITQLLTALQPVITAIAAWLPGAIKQAEPHLHTLVAGAIQIGTVIVTRVLPVLLQLAQWILAHVVPAVMTLAGFIAQHVIPVVISLAGWFKDHVLPILQVLATVILTNVLPALANVWQSIATNLVPAIEHLWEKLSPVLIPALQLVGWVLQNIVGPALGFAIGLVGKLIDAIATIIGKIGDFLGVLGHVKDAVGGAFKGVGDALHNLHLPGFATGGVMPYSGLAVVGERGPEVVALPQGARVYTAAESARMYGGGQRASISYNIYPAQAQFGPDELDALTRRHALLASTSGGY